MSYPYATPEETELPGRSGYEVIEESRFDRYPGEAKTFLGTVPHYVFAGREVFRTRLDIFTGEHMREWEWRLAASCATPEAALAAQRLLNSEPKPQPPMLRLVKSR